MNHYKCHVSIGYEVRPGTWRLTRKSRAIYVDSPDAERARTYVRKNIAPRYLAAVRPTEVKYNDTMILTNPSIRNITASVVPPNVCMEKIGSPSLFNLSDFDPEESKKTGYEEQSK